MRATRIVMLFGFVIGLYALFAGNANAQCVMSLNGDRPAFPNRSAFQELRAQIGLLVRQIAKDADLPFVLFRRLQRRPCSRRRIGHQTRWFVIGMLALFGACHRDLIAAGDEIIG